MGTQVVGLEGSVWVPRLNGVASMLSSSSVWRSSSSPISIRGCFARSCSLWSCGDPGALRGLVVGLGVFHPFDDVVELLALFGNFPCISSRMVLVCT
jgi:hypothetical protein